MKPCIVDTDSSFRIVDPLLVNSKSKNDSFSASDLSTLSFKNRDLVTIHMNNHAGKICMAKIDKQKDLLLLGFGPCIGIIAHDSNSGETVGVHLTPWEYKLKPHPMDMLTRKYISQRLADAELFRSMFTSRLSEFADLLSDSEPLALKMVTFGGLKIDKTIPHFAQTNKNNQRSVETAIDYLELRLGVTNAQLVRKDAWAEDSYNQYGTIGAYISGNNPTAQILAAQDLNLHYEPIELVPLF